MSRGAIGGVLGVLVSAGCVSPVDQPSNVHDLRVLGVSVEVPELMAPACDPNDPQFIATAVTPLRYTALIADPNGAGRSISYDLSACANTTDTTCSTASETVQIAPSGTTAATNLAVELPLDIVPGAALTADGTPLLIKVQQDDPYKGLGGLRMPLMLHLVAGSEEIYAEKLMVFNCKTYPDMQANQTPHLRGFHLQDVEWPPGAGVIQHGSGPFHVTADDISDLEEAYGVRAFDLSEVHLKESWTIAWYTTLGTFGPDSTGGTDFAGQQDPHSTQWTPSAGATEQDVTFWFVVRDGRGGLSWSTRQLHYIP